MRKPLKGLPFAFQEPGENVLARRAANSIVLDTQPGTDLCCGLAGRLYALIRVFRETSDDRLRTLAFEMALDGLRWASARLQ